jgi:anti-sigma factor RsiW
VKVPFRSRSRDRGIACREAVELMAAYLDGVLPDVDRARLEGHLAGCPNCTEYLAQLRVTIDALGHVEPEDLPAEALDELVTVYRRFHAS